MTEDRFYYRIKKNQYTKNLETKEHIYLWLMRNCEMIYDRSQTFCCYVPYRGTKGIDFCLGSTNHPAHIRISWNGKKVIASEFVKNYIENRNSPPNNCICSHRCHNPYCLNENHIVYELQDDRTRQVTNNIGRIGCPGFVIVQNRNIIKVCTHDPFCMKTTYVNSYFNRNTFINLTE